MKILRILLYILMFALVIGLIVYAIWFQKNLEFGDIVKIVLALASLVLAGFRLTSGKKVVNKKQLYQKAYSEFIQNAFAEEPKLEKVFYNAVHDYNRNKPSAAIAKLDRLRKECTRSTDLRAVTVFTALCYDDMGLYEKALTQYDAARKIRDSTTLASNMGLCYQRIGNFGQSQAMYEEAIQLDNRNANAYNNLSCLYFSEGDYESALESAEDAIQCNARMPQALSTAAVCCAILGEEEQYQDYYRRAVAAGYDGKKIKDCIKRLDPTLS